MSVWQWVCYHCKMVMAIQNNSGGPPDPKAGGPCPKSCDGNHSWQDRKEISK